MSPSALIAVVVVVVAVCAVLVRSVRVVPQATAAVVERLGRFQRVLEPGLSLLVPFTDRIRARIDLREQVITFPPQPVITSDNVTQSPAGRASWLVEAGSAPASDPATRRGPAGGLDTSTWFDGEQGDRTGPVRAGADRLILGGPPPDRRNTITATAAGRLPAPSRW